MLNDLDSAVPEGCASDLVLDEWRAGELDAVRRGTLEQHVADCARCSTRAQTFAVAAQAFLAENRFERLRSDNQEQPAFADVPASRARSTPRTLWTRTVAAGGAVLLSLAAAALLWVRSSPDAVRRKGSDHFGFFVKRGVLVYRGQAGERLRRGDQLRFVVSVERARFVAILSIDARSNVSVYHPVSASSVSVGPGRELALDSGVELDNAQGPERIYALFCDQPIDLASVRTALQQTQRLRTTAQCNVDELAVIKESAR